jgi:hypothetical protein
LPNSWLNFRPTAVNEVWHRPDHSERERLELK